MFHRVRFSSLYSQFGHITISLISGRRRFPSLLVDSAFWGSRGRFMVFWLPLSRPTFGSVLEPLWDHPKYAKTGYKMGSEMGRKSASERAQRATEGANERMAQRTIERTNTNERTNEETSHARAKARNNGRTNTRMKDRTNQRTNEQTN